MRLMAGVARCLLLCTVLLVLPAIVASQLTPLTVQRVWTQDTGGTEKTSFLPGETIQFAAELNNPYGGWLLGANGTRLTITTSFYTDTKSVDIPPGISTWTWNATAPSTEDTYTVTVQAYDHASGTLPEGSANFTITLGQTPPPEQICHTFDDQQPVREGWGAAYDVFSAEHEVLLKATCTPNETQITVGNNNADTYIYHLAHYWINEQEDGDKELQCNGEKVDNTWCVGEATAVIPVQSQYFAAYTCRKIDGSWKCGCRDKQCAQNLWQLQGIQVSTESRGLSIPSTGQMFNLFLDTTSGETWYAKYYDQDNTLQTRPQRGTHSGIDISNNQKDCDKAVSPVYSAASGTVIWAGWAGPGFGWSVVVKHGYDLMNNRHYTYTLYGHMGTVGSDSQTSQGCLEVQVGNSVHVNTLLGYQGSSGLSARATHVHFMVFVGDEDVTELSSPYDFINKYDTFPASPDYYTCMELTLGDPSPETSVVRGQNKCSMAR